MECHGTVWPNFGHASASTSHAASPPNKFPVFGEIALHGCLAVGDDLICLCRKNCSRKREREREIGRESRKLKVSKMSCGTFDLNQPLYIHIMTPLVFFLFRKREPRPSVDLVSRPRWTPLVRCPAGGRTPVVGALRAKRWRRLVSPVVGSWTSTAPWLRPTPSLTPWCTLGSIL